MEEYNQRFLEEYNDITERVYRLGNLLSQWEILSFDPMCSYDILYKQYKIMCEYKYILEQRAVLEKIKL